MKTIGILSQKQIRKWCQPEWKVFFTHRQYLYLKNLINRLLETEDADMMCEYGEKGGKKYFHIYEPFCYGFNAPSCVSLGFDDEQIEFWFGHDNGCTLFDPQMHLSNTTTFPEKMTPGGIYWHFVENVGGMGDFDEDEDEEFIASDIEYEGNPDIDILESPLEELFYKEAMQHEEIWGMLLQENIGKYRVDFLVRDIVIEIDGKTYHSSQEQRNYDKIRQKEIEGQGFTVIRFTGDDLQKDVKSCVQKVIKALNNQ